MKPKCERAKTNATDGKGGAEMTVEERLDGLEAVVYLLADAVLARVKANERMNKLRGKVSLFANKPLQEKGEAREAEKRDIPPTPPIESKGEENEEGREHYISPRARVREGAGAFGETAARIDGLADKLAELAQTVAELKRTVVGERSRKFTPPTLDEVTAYCNKRRNKVDPVLWYDFYESKGWLIGKVKMKDWKSAVRTWERNTISDTSGAAGRKVIIPTRKADNWIGAPKGEKTVF